MWDAVQAEGRLLVTADKGLADASLRPPGSHAGIVLFRLYPESRRGYVELAQRLVDTTRLDVLVGTIAVVTIDRLRIHRG